MTLDPADLALYAAALLALFLTPGPVWLALIARGLSGGFHAAWPLALGVVVGDALWPLLAILGVSWIVAEVDWLLAALKIVAAIIFVVMGAGLVARADHGLTADPRLTRPGAAAGFAAGLAVILVNPKAILFYMGVLPGFFDLGQVTAPDIAAIVALSMLVPLLGNLVFAATLGHVRSLLTSPKAVRRLNLVSGALLVVVGLTIAVT